MSAPSCAEALDYRSQDRASGGPHSARAVPNRTASILLFRDDHTPTDMSISRRCKRTAQAKWLSLPYSRSSRIELSPEALSLPETPNDEGWC